MRDDNYHPPLALSIISWIFLGHGAVYFLIIAIDILLRRGWRTMMPIMILVYPINALYMMPLTIWLYFKHGRPTVRTPGALLDHSTETQPGKSMVTSTTHQLHDLEPHHNKPREQSTSTQAPVDPAIEILPTNANSHCCHHTSSPRPARPTWVTVAIGVSHCGAGCVLGDVVGEWLVWGTGAKLGGAPIWAELLIDYAFALLFGIAFQYFSIAPMSGDWGLRSVWRAAKADILSLTSFEIGALGWMVVYQVAIFDYKLSVTTWVYWWMMQMGMVLGFATALPMNYFLLKYGIKEPCC